MPPKPHNESSKSLGRSRRLGRPPKSMGQNSRALILEAALDLFSTKGYEATTVREIGARVGVSDAALYAHFDGKAAIREELFNMHGPRALVLFDKADVGLLVANPLEYARSRLHQLAHRWLEPGERKFFRFLLMENLKVDIETSLSVAEVQAPLKNSLRQISRLLIERGIAIQVDPEWLLGQFLWPIQVMRSEVALSGDNVDLEQLKARLDTHLDNFAKVFLPGI